MTNNVIVQLLERFRENKPNRKYYFIYKNVLKYHYKYWGWSNFSIKKKSESVIIFKTKQSYVLYTCCIFPSLDQFRCVLTKLLQI